MFSRVDSFEKWKFSFVVRKSRVHDDHNDDPDEKFHGFQNEA